VDDAAYLNDVITAAQSLYNIDAQRIYVAGADAGCVLQAAPTDLPFIARRLIGSET
jgi:poly(3-hydroxybutyrate) depolymerase